MMRACSPRGPLYSGKLIARAVELYLEGVKPGYMRWHDLQIRLEEEFPSEIPEKAQDKPSPQTIINWARKYPDAPERLRKLRVQQATLPFGAVWNPLKPSYCYPAVVKMPVRYAGTAYQTINALFSQFTALMVLALMAGCIASMAHSRYQ